MGKKGYSKKGLFGDIIHYDEHGKKIGHSTPSLFGGGYNHYSNRNDGAGSNDSFFFDHRKHHK